MLLNLKTFWLCLTPFPHRSYVQGLALIPIVTILPSLPTNHPEIGCKQHEVQSYMWATHMCELPRWNELCSQSCLSKIGFYVPEGMCSRACFIRNINIGNAEIQFLLHPAGSWHWAIWYCGRRAETVCTTAAHSLSELKEKSWSFQGWPRSIFCH